VDNFSLSFFQSFFVDIDSELISSLPWIQPVWNQSRALVHRERSVIYTERVAGACILRKILSEDENKFLIWHRTLFVSITTFRFSVM